MMNKLLAFAFLTLLASCASNQVSQVDNATVSQNPVINADMFADLLLNLDANKVNDQRVQHADEDYLKMNNSNSRAPKVIE